MIPLRKTIDLDKPLRITATGRPGETHVYDAEGQEIDGITRVSFEADCHGVSAVVEIEPPYLEMELRAGCTKLRVDFGADQVAAIIAAYCARNGLQVTRGHAENMAKELLTGR